MCLAIPGPAMIQLPAVGGEKGAFSQAAEFLKYPNSMAAPQDGPL